MDDYDDGLDLDLDEHFELMRKAASILAQIRSNAETMRWQFGEPDVFKDLVAEIEAAQDTWIRSNC